MIAPLAICIALAPIAVTKVAVLDIAAKAGFSKEKRDVFSEFLQATLRERGFEVIARSDIETVLGLEKMKDALSCSSASCLVELGGALGVNEIVTGTIANLSPYLMITLKRLDAKRGMVIKQASRKIMSGGDAQLAESIEPLVAELYGQVPSSLPPPSNKRSAFSGAGFEENSDTSKAAKAAEQEHRPKVIAKVRVHRAPERDGRIAFDRTTPQLPAGTHFESGPVHGLWISGMAIFVAAYLVGGFVSMIFDPGTSGRSRAVGWIPVGGPIMANTLVGVSLLPVEIGSLVLTIVGALYQRTYVVSDRVSLTVRPVPELRF